MPAFACAFDCIGHEIEQNLFKPCRIATYGIVLHFGAQRHPLVLKYIFTLGAVAIHSLPVTVYSPGRGSIVLLVRENAGGIVPLN